MRGRILAEKNEKVKHQATYNSDGSNYASPRREERSIIITLIHRRTRTSLEGGGAQATKNIPERVTRASGTVMTWRQFGIPRRAICRLSGPALMSDRVRLFRALL